MGIMPYGGNRETWYAKCSDLAKRGWMRNLLVFLVFGVCTAATPLQQNHGRGPAGRTSLTGCVDERDGQYILSNDRNLQPVARLRPAAGSPEDNFARHVGDKVTMPGRLSRQDPVPVMVVESLATVTQACAPATETHQ